MGSSCSSTSAAGAAVPVSAAAANRQPTSSSSRHQLPANSRPVLRISTASVHQAATGADEMQAVEVCHNDEIKEGSFREVSLGEFPVLVGRSDSRLFAVGAKCSHYGLKMTDGSMSNGRLRCPFHGACFNVHSGDIEDSPGLDCLPTFGVRVRQSDGMVLLEGKQPDSIRRVKPSASYSDMFAKESFVIVGGGPSASAAAETLRQEGFRGPLTVISSESLLPYDRTKLSKSFSSQPPPLREADFYEQRDIRFLLQTTVTAVKPGDAMLLADSPQGQQSIAFAKLLVCSGQSPRLLQTPTAPASGVHYLRTVEDAARISKELGSESSEAVVIGSSFIAIESASCLVAAGAKSVTVVMRDSQPFRSVFGDEFGQLVRQMCEQKGVHFVQDEVQGFETAMGADNQLAAVVLKSGKQLQANLCIVGIGSVPNTSFLPEEFLDSRRFLKVDANFRSVADQRVFGAGDVTGGGHWQTAQTFGRLAARAMLGKEVAAKRPKVAFFWTFVFGTGIRYVSLATNSISWKRSVVKGSLADRKFMMYYLDGNDCAVAGAGIGMSKEPASLAAQLEAGEPVPLADLPLND